MSPASPADWGPYLARFHTERAGITERILARCRADGTDPYEWCARPLRGFGGPCLDIACGSGPLSDHVTGWIGADVSAAELAIAADQGRGPVLRASATQLPIATSSTAAVSCSMGLHVIDPFPAAVAEVARVLAPSGRAAVLLPATGPLGGRDIALYLRLEVALRRRIRYPNDRALGRRRIATEATRHGLVVTTDERCTFALPLETQRHIEELISSLYLPELDATRHRRACRVLDRRLGDVVSVPLRRVVLDARR